jgi:hypothetical protein
MAALHELISRYGVEVDGNLDREADIPVLTSPQIQGDVSIRPIRRRVAGRRMSGHRVQDGGITWRWVRGRWVRRRDAGGWRPAVTPIPAVGIVVSTGREGHEHRLLPGPARFDLVISPGPALLIGILTVPAGCEQYLAHDQHGYLGIGPGTFEVGCQREWVPPSPRVRSGGRQFLD